MESEFTYQELPALQSGDAAHPSLQTAYESDLSETSTLVDPSSPESYRLDYSSPPPVNFEDYNEELEESDEAATLPGQDEHLTHLEQTQVQQAQEAVVWSVEDEQFAQLFNFWDRLPVGTNASWEDKMFVLRALENVIVPFEAVIGNSDEAFSAWRLRHQAAMTANYSITPLWPMLLDPRRGWINGKWNERYRYLILQREKLIDWRVQSLRWKSLDRGTLVACPQRLAIMATSRRANAHKNTQIPEFWAQSLESVVTAKAASLRANATVSISNFWNQAPLAQRLQALAPSSESEIFDPFVRPWTRTYDQAHFQSPTQHPAFRADDQDVIMLDYESA